MEISSYIANGSVSRLEVLGETNFPLFVTKVFDIFFVDGDGELVLGPHLEVVWINPSREFSIRLLRLRFSRLAVNTQHEDTWEGI